MSAVPLGTEIYVEGADEAKASLTDFFQTFVTGKGNIDEAVASLREHAKAIYGGRRALMLIRTEWRLQHAAWLEGARLMRDVGRIGNAITQMWQAYNIAQIRIEKAERSLTEAKRDATTSLRTYLRYLRDFTAESVFTKGAAEDLTEAIEAHKRATEDLAKAQNDMRIGYVGIALQMGGLLATIPITIMHLHMVKSTLAASGASALSLGSAIGSVVTGFLLAIPMFGIWATGFRNITEGMRLLYGESHPLVAALEGFTSGLEMASLGTAPLLQDLMGLTETYKQIRGEMEEAEETAERSKSSYEILADTYNELGYSIEQVRKQLDDLGYSQDYIHQVIVAMTSDIATQTGKIDELAQGYADLGYTIGQAHTALNYLGLDVEVIKAVMDALWELYYGAVGGSVFPELVAWTEKAQRALGNLSAEFPRFDTLTPSTATSPSHVQVTNIFGSITSELDLERAGETIYRAFLRKLERLS